jgi:hypothetical protein
MPASFPIRVVCPLVALCVHGPMSDLSPSCAAKRTWAQAEKTACEKITSALGGDKRRKFSPAFRIRSAIRPAILYLTYPNH